MLAVLAVLGGAGWGGWYLLEGRWTAAPALANMTQADAESAAALADIKVDFQQEFSEDVKAGEVIRTEPAEGHRVLREGTITAWISRGPERFAVPAVSGKSREDAQQLITGGSLSVGAVTEQFDDKVAAGTVISQGSKAGEQVKRGTAVDIVVSKGPAPVDVVGFAGKPLGELQAWAKANLITLTASEENHDTVPKGAVISQDPAGGQLHRGGAMSVVVSKGPVMVTVPTGLRGLGADAAAQRVRDAGLVPEFKRLVPLTFGTVYGVDPGEGASVPKGSKVIISLV